MLNENLNETLSESVVSYACLRYDSQMLSSIAKHMILASENEGDIVFLGCKEPRVVAWITQCKKELSIDKEIWVFEPFSKIGSFGPSCKHQSIDDLECDQMAGVDNIESVCAEFSVDIPQICAGWFKYSLETSLPKKICFIHMDCGFYDEILEGLIQTYDRIVPGARMIINAYGSGWVNCVKNATDAFFAGNPEKPEIILHNSVGQHALIIKAGVSMDVQNITGIGK